MCHTDFDGLCSAAKWMREGIECYPGADDDARAIDTRLGTPSPIARRFDRAIRARPRDTGLLGIIVRHLATGLADDSLWTPIDTAGAELEAVEKTTFELARGYRKLDLPREVVAGCTSIAFVDVTGRTSPARRYDKTQLLLLGQERAAVALLVDQDTLTLAAPFDSGIDFLSLFGLSGACPRSSRSGRTACRRLSRGSACRNPRSTRCVDPDANGHLRGKPRGVPRRHAAPTWAHPRFSFAMRPFSHGTSLTLDSGAW